MSGCFRGEKGTPISLDRKTAQHLGMGKTACFWNRADLWYLGLGNTTLTVHPFLIFKNLLVPNPLNNKRKWSLNVAGGGENTKRQRCGGMRPLCPLVRFKSFQAGRPI